MTCTLTDGATKCRRWRYCRPTRPHLEGPSRLNSSTQVDLLDPTRRSNISRTTIHSKYQYIWNSIYGVTSHTAAVWLAYVDTGHTATYLFIGTVIR